MKLEVTLTEKEYFAILSGLILLEKEHSEDAKIVKSAYHKMFDADLKTWCRKQGIEQK